MSGTTTAEFSESHGSAHESSDNRVLIKQDLSKKDCSGPPNDLHSEPSVPIAQAEVQTFSQKTDIQADAQTDPAQAHSTDVAVIATVVATPADVQTNMCKIAQAELEADHIATEPSQQPNEEVFPLTTQDDLFPEVDQTSVQGADEDLSISHAMFPDPSLQTQDDLFPEVHKPSVDTDEDHNDLHSMLSDPFPATQDDLSPEFEQSLATHDDRSQSNIYDLISDPSLCSLVPNEIQTAPDAVATSAISKAEEAAEAATTAPTGVDVASFIAPWYHYASVV